MASSAGIGSYGSMVDTPITGWFGMDNSNGSFGGTPI